MDSKKIIMCEELSINAQPSLYTHLFDGWLLRLANGYTKRANSVNVLYPSELPFEEKVEFCEAFYENAGLDTVFKLTPQSTQLGEYLALQGYELVAPTKVLLRDELSFEASPEVTLTEDIDAYWRENFFRLNKTGDKETASAMLALIKNTVVCAYIEKAGEVVACGLCIIERGFAGLFDIVVDGGCRNRGLGYKLCSALLAKAAELGAKKGYIQVVAENSPALRLYEKLGYQPGYEYWYRVKKGRGQTV